MEGRFWSIDDVARKLSVSPSSVRRWIRNGKLIGKKAGAQWRFDPAVVRAALEEGRLSEVSMAQRNQHRFASSRPPEWVGPILSRWRRGLVDQLQREQPDHVVVTDRRGSKIWALLMPDQYSWGSNLWHSAAIKHMPQAELRRLVAGKKVLLFDEIMQHGREMHGLRKHLEGADATTVSVVCVRRRKFVDTGELLEYDAVACEDLDDEQFADRAAIVSRLTSSFEPPLDVGHLVIHGTIHGELDEERLVERMANWGIPFVIWHPDANQPLLAITLDRPQFFETAELQLLQNFIVDWEGPCKIRFYIDLESKAVYCSFIVYPGLEAPMDIWTQSSDAAQRAKQLDVFAREQGPEQLLHDDDAVRRVYWTVCLELAWLLLNDFINSGAAKAIGIRLDHAADRLDAGLFFATFGLSLGDKILKRTRELLSSERPSELLQKAISQPPPLLIRHDPPDAALSYDDFDCRTELLKAVPQKHTSPASLHQRAISYGQLLRHLSRFSESTVGRVLDYELDRGTTKPDVEIESSEGAGQKTVRVWRGFCRGEFGVWFEWQGQAPTYVDAIIKRTVLLGPTVVDLFLRKTGSEVLTATHFAKLFANLQHDWRTEFGPLYLGWRPYKYGPVPIVPTSSQGQEGMPFEHFLLRYECLTRSTEQHGSQEWSRYAVPSDSPVPWREAYEMHTSDIARAHTRGLVRLYAAIQQNCKTQRPTKPGSAFYSTFGDPLVVLGAARNNKIAYRCAWFEVSDWIRKGQEVLFPLIGIFSETSAAPAAPSLEGHLEEFAAPARLLYDKIEMYRNLPFLRDQLERLCRSGDYEAAEVLFKTVDVTPEFEADSEYPMQGLEWACSIMRAFSSFLRQVLTACGLDRDKRSERAKTDEIGRPRDAGSYLAELLRYCNELESLKGDLEACIAESAKGRLTPATSETLAKAFHLILRLFDHPGRIPDPRPHHMRGRNHTQRRDDLIVRVRSIQLSGAYAVSIADIRNLGNLPSLGPLFGVEPEPALDNLLNWVEKRAHEIAERHRSVTFHGRVADNIIFAGHNADEAYLATRSLIRETTQRLGGVDRSQLAYFGLLRAGIAWFDQQMGDHFRGVRPGIIALKVGDKPGRGPGAITITASVHERLAPVHQAEFNCTSEVCDQGAVWVRTWCGERDGG